MYAFDSAAGAAARQRDARVRHHYASVLLDAGESIKAVSEYLGHADAGFTLRTYTHLMPSSDERTRQAVDGALAHYITATSSPESTLSRRESPLTTTYEHLWQKGPWRLFAGALSLVRRHRSTTPPICTTDTLPTRALVSAQRQMQPCPPIPRRCPRPGLTDDHVQGRAPMAPEKLWDLHGGSLLALARTLLGDESAAQRAVAAGLAALYQDRGDTGATLTLPVAARYVFAHSEAMRSHGALVTFEGTDASGTSTFRQMALNQRRMLALCIYGGYTYRDAAAAIGVSAETAARLVTTALKRSRQAPPSASGVT